MQDPILPVPVSVPDLNDTAPRLLDGDDGPGFYCVWLSDDSRRAFASDGDTEKEVDYRHHRRWSETALEEFTDEYSARLLPSDEAAEDPGVDTLDDFVHSLCLNLRNEPGHRGWSYLFNRRDGRSYVCVRWRALRFCREANRGGPDDGTGYEDGDVVSRVGSMDPAGRTR